MKNGFLIVARTVIVCLLIVFIKTAALGQPQADKWEKFSSPEGKFNILTPSKPKLDVKDVESAQGTLKLYFYGASGTAGFFAASYGDYTLEAKTADEKATVLDGVRNGINKGINGKLVSERKISLYGYPGREIVIDAKLQDTDVIFKWRIFLMGKRLYQIGVGTDVRNSGSPDVDKFLLSFDLDK